MKQQIEIDVPEGMRICKVQQINVGIGVTVMLEPIPEPEPEPPKTKRRPPTKHDLLSVDSLPCWVRDRDCDMWVRRELTSVGRHCVGHTMYHTSGVTWNYCEIEVPADEQPLREAWVECFRKDGDPWGAAWPTPDRSSDEYMESIHMIEVRP